MGLRGGVDKLCSEKVLWVSGHGQVVFRRGLRDGCTLDMLRSEEVPRGGGHTGPAVFRRGLRCGLAGCVQNFKRGLWGGLAGFVQKRSPGRVGRLCSEEVSREGWQVVFRTDRGVERL